MASLPPRLTARNLLRRPAAKAHVAYEENFWSTKMGLTGASSEALASTKTAYETFLGDPENLKAVRAAAATPGLTEEQKARPGEQLPKLKQAVPAVGSRQ